MALVLLGPRCSYSKNLWNLGSARDWLLELWIRDLLQQDTQCISFQLFLLARSHSFTVHFTIGTKNKPILSKHHGSTFIHSFIQSLMHAWSLWVKSPISCWQPLVIWIELCSKALWVLTTHGTKAFAIRTWLTVLVSRLMTILFANLTLCSSIGWEPTAKSLLSSSKFHSVSIFSMLTRSHKSLVVQCMAGLRDCHHHFKYVERLDSIVPLYYEVWLVLVGQDLCVWKFVTRSRKSDRQWRNSVERMSLTWIVHFGGERKYVQVLKSRLLSHYNQDCPSDCKHMNEAMQSNTRQLWCI